MINQKKAYIYASVAIFFWSTVASAFKIALNEVDFLQLLLFASFISLIALFTIIIAQNKLYLLKQTTIKDYLFSALLGFLNPFLYYTVLFKAYTLLPAQEAQPLNFTWPIILVLLSIPMLHQKIHFKDIIAILISFLGVIIISSHGNILSLKFSNPFGTGLAISTSVVWGLFWIFNKKDNRDEVIKLFINFIFGFIFVAITTIIFSDITLPNMKGILSISYIGLFEMGITFVVWSKALKLSKTTAKVSNLIFLAPFLSLIIIHFVIGEDILPSTIIGLFFIVFGILLQQCILKSK